MKAIVGLGNPGTKYERTRHNAGFWVVDAVSKATGIRLSARQDHGVTGLGTFEGASILLCKPQTYMNNSGRCVRALADRYGIAPTDILVIYDELALPPGTIRMRAKGSAGGHNGVKSVINSLGTDHFPRLRIGVGSVPEGMAGVEYVLAAPTPDELEKIEHAVDVASRAALCWVMDGVEAAMSQYNRAWA